MYVFFFCLFVYFIIIIIFKCVANDNWKGLQLGHHALKTRATPLLKLPFWFVPYLVTPLYIEAPLENPLLFLFTPKTNFFKKNVSISNSITIEHDDVVDNNWTKQIIKEFQYFACISKYLLKLATNSCLVMFFISSSSFS